MIIFARHPKNVLQAAPSVNMADGWETARHVDRPPILLVNQSGLLNVSGSDWAIFKMGAVGKVHHVVIETIHFKGNYPESVQIEGCLLLEGQSSDDEMLESAKYKIVVPRSKLGPNASHTFMAVESLQAVDCIKVTIFPDGGISRLRVSGKPILTA